MKTIKTPIIPIHSTFVKVKNQPHTLDYKAICVFSALGFFLDTDTYWLDEKVLPPATINTIDDDGFWISSTPWFKWYYKPKNINLQKAVKDFGVLFEQIIQEQTKDKQVILPLSGGLDSRSQAVALQKTGATVNTYSYSFENGYKESAISQKIAQKCNFNFQEFVIHKGYLWNKIQELSKTNNCYSEFTHPRQMAVINEVATLGNTFSLGHWGDVLFDAENHPENLDDRALVTVLKNKVLKKGGLALANKLWEHWNLTGSFESYLNDRILVLLQKININNANAKIRAFKSLYWAPRWTSVNLSVFANKHPVTLPYYDDRMCKFICEIPEALLANRQIQIAYIKQANPKVAKIVWQDAKPFHLFNHHLSKFPYNFPYKVFNKLKRKTNTLLGKKFVQRNWELQFLGKKNQEALQQYLFDNQFSKQIDKNIVTHFWTLFYGQNQVYYSHAVSTLLTLSLFFKNQQDG